MQKTRRDIKVNATSGYKYKEVPTITLKGDYLKEFGFPINTRVSVELSEGKILITAVQ